MTEKRCGTCVYYSDDGEDNFGVCRRHAPPTSTASMGADAESFVAFWPVVHDREWCGEGEWQPKPEDIPDPMLLRLFYGRLPGRARRAFRKLGVQEIEDVLKVHADDLLDQRDFGDCTLRIVREGLAECGLALAGE